MNDISDNESASMVPVSSSEVIGLESVKEMFQAYGIDSQDENLDQIPSDANNRICIVSTRICSSGRCVTGIGVVEGQEDQSIGDIIDDARKEAEQDALSHFERLPRQNRVQLPTQHGVAYRSGSDKITEKQKGCICKMARKLEQGTGEAFAREMWNKPLDELTRKEASISIDKLTQIEQEAY